MRLLSKVFAAFERNDALSQGDLEKRWDGRSKYVSLNQHGAQLVSSGCAPVLYVNAATSHTLASNTSASPMQTAEPAAKRYNWRLLDDTCVTRLSLKIPTESLQLIMCQDIAAMNGILSSIVDACEATVRVEPRRDPQDAMLGPMLDQVFYMSQVLHNESTRVYNEQRQVFQCQALQEELITTVHEEHDERLVIEGDRDDIMALLFDISQAYCLFYEAAMFIFRQEEVDYTALITAFRIGHEKLFSIEQRHQQFVNLRHQWTSAENTERTCIVEEENISRVWASYLWVTEQDALVERELILHQEDTEWIALVQKIFSYFSTLVGMDVLRIQEESHREVLEHAYMRELQRLPMICKNELKIKRDARAAAKKRKMEERAKQKASIAAAAKAEARRNKKNGTSFWETNVGKNVPRKQTPVCDLENHSSSDESEAVINVPEFTPAATGTNSRSLSGMVTDHKSRRLFVHADVPNALRHLQPTPEKEELDRTPATPPSRVEDAPYKNDGFVPDTLETDPCPRWYRNLPQVRYQSCVLVQSHVRAAMSTLVFWKMFIRVHHSKLELIAAFWKMKCVLPSKRRQGRYKIECMSEDFVHFNRSIQRITFDETRMVDGSTMPLPMERSDFYVPMLSLFVKEVMSQSDCHRCAPVVLSLWDRLRGIDGEPNVVCLRIPIVRRDRGRGTLSVKAALISKYSDALCPTCQSIFGECSGLSELMATSRYYDQQPISRKFFNHEIAVLTICYVQATLRTMRALRLLHKKRSQYFSRHKYRMRHLSLIIGLQVRWRFRKHYGAVPQWERCSAVLDCLEKRTRSTANVSLSTTFESYLKWLCTSLECNCTIRYRFLVASWKKFHVYGQRVFNRLRVLRLVSRATNTVGTQCACSTRCAAILNALRSRLRAYPGAVRKPSFWLYNHFLCKRNVVCRSILQGLIVEAYCSVRYALFIRERFAFVIKCRNSALEQWRDRFRRSERPGNVCFKCSMFLDQLRLYLGSHKQASEAKISQYTEHVCARCATVLPSTVGTFITKRNAARFFSCRYHWILHWRKVQQSHENLKKARRTRGTCSRCDPILAQMHRRADMRRWQPAPDEIEKWTAWLCTRCIPSGEKIAAKYSSPEFEGTDIHGTPQFHRDASIIQMLLRTKLSEEEVILRKVKMAEWARKHAVQALAVPNNRPARIFKEPTPEPVAEHAIHEPPSYPSDGTCVECNTPLRVGEAWCYYCGAFRE